jgi:hypothetical protein
MVKHVNTRRFAGGMADAGVREPVLPKAPATSCEPYGLAVHHQRDVAVVPADGLLVDQQDAQVVQVWWRELALQDRLVPATGRDVIDADDLLDVHQRKMAGQLADKLHGPTRGPGVGSIPSGWTVENPPQALQRPWTAG